MKVRLYQHLYINTEARIAELQQDIESLTASQGNETKSSAGDKYETGRAMLQQELDKNQQQLSTAIELKHTLEKINLTDKCIKVGLGTLVITNQGNYFISIGFGKIELEGKLYYAISQGSPIGKILLNKKIGDKVKYLDKEFEIKDLY